MPRITLFKLIKYREWTEELGFDREGLIQVKQAEIYSYLQKLLWEKDCFILPLRYDYLIALTNNLGKNDLEYIVEEVEPYTPYGLKAVSLTHGYPAIAQLLASRIIEENNEKTVFIDGKEDENVITHIDLNNVSELTIQTSIYESYLEILTLYYNISRNIYELGGIANYLGGDNLLAILPRNEYEKIIRLIPSSLKIGIGISINPRKALLLAAKALSSIRRGETTSNYLVYHDSI